MTKWFLLAGSVGSEVVASLSLKAALTHPALYVVVLLGYVSAFTFLTLVLKRGMALGVAYGIWGALGVAATAVLSAVLFRERLTAMAGVGIILVIAGVLMVELGAQHVRSADEQKAEVA